MKTSLPKWIERFLRTICPDELYDEIEGDLIESFNRKLKNSGLSTAHWYLFINVIKYFRPGIILRNRISGAPINSAILHNYFLTSYRHVMRDKVNAAFKVFGLSLSLFALAVIILYISYELSFDRYHNDHDRIFRVNTQRLENGNIEQYGIAPLAFGQLFKDNFPEIESFTRLDVANGSHLTYKQKVVYGGVFGVDPTWFNLFSHTFIKGTPNALMRPATIVLTLTLAKKIFGDEDPMGKVLTINNGPTLYEVAGITADAPSNSHLHIEAFVPIDRMQSFTDQHISSPPDFVDNSAVLFVKLRDRVSTQQFVSQVEKMLDQHIPRKRRGELGFKVFLQPLADIYLDAPLKYEFSGKGNVIYLYIFAITGIFILLISCINYANLSLAGFMNRSREMGIRKVFGSKKTQIIWHVALETILYAIVGMLAAAILLYLIFPKVQQYVEPNLRLTSIASPTFLWSASLIIVSLIILSTAIPSVWFARNSIGNDLKGVLAQGRKMKFNNALLLVQFVISMICIGATLTIGKQIDFIHHKDLGIDRKNLLVLSMPEDFTVDKMVAFKSSIKNIPGITHASNSSFRMGGGYWKDWYSVQVNGDMRSLELYEVFSDDALFETLGMKVLQGRVFDATQPADSGSAFVINETAARHLGLTDPVGTKILTHPEEPGKWEGTIVGVVNDININTLHHPVKPLVMRLPWQNNYPEYFVYVRFEGSSEHIIQSIKKIYSEHQPGYPLEVHFVDDFYNNEYEKENRAYASLKFASMVIMIISCLGIFSLSIYLSTRKMKEFGIRKVLGASAEQITYLHVWHFVRVAVIAMFIAFPITSLLMAEWLKSFAYHTTPGIETATLVIAVTITAIILSAGYAALRAGSMNPVKVINKV